MARALERVIEDVKAHPFAEQAKDLEATYRFEVEGGGGFRLQVDHGRLSVTEDGGAADCVIAASREDLERIIDGEQNMLTAYMQGRLRIEGDLAVAKRFHGALPGPSISSAGRGREEQR